MRVLYTLAYPEFNTADQAFVEAVRAKHDARYHLLLAPHFTLVFGSTGVEDDAYVDHVRRCVSDVQEISFVCRYAMLGGVEPDGSSCVYLVPDEGYSRFTLLHDRLYSKLLSSRLRLDQLYIPHITIGRLPSREAAKALCDELNGQGLELRGMVRDIDVCVHVDGALRPVMSLPLHPVVALPSTAPTPASAY